MSAAGMNQPGMVIIGAGMAGARACINFRASDYQGEITLIGEEHLLPYDRPPLSKASMLEEGEPQPVWLLEPDIVASLKVHAMLGVAVAKIDRAAKEVILADGRKVPYAKLLIATGAKPRNLGPNALTLRDHKDTLELRQRFKPGQSVVIVGGGFIGLELASSAAKLGCKVTLIEAQPRILMRGVPEPIARIIHDRHVAAGVEMLVGTAIESINTHSVTLKSGREIKADTIVAGIGAAPEVRLAQEAGLAIENGIACNAQLQTSDPDIYAAGDCCSFIHENLGGRRIRLEAWRSAQEQSATAVSNMLGGSKAHVSVPWFWSDQYELGLQIAGMADMGPVTVTRTVSPDTMMLFHMSENGTIMGASAIGPGNAIARDLKLAEMMIAKGLKPDPAALADPAVQLKTLLKG
jgi:3-phenylpropionate/trans-cinnamate dioxygenase ferredoxin reductase subunit